MVPLRRSIMLGTVLVGIGLSAPQVTQAQSSAVWVSTRVEGQCRVTGSRLEFGTYNPIGAHATSPLDAESVFEVQCTPGSRVKVGLEPGLNAVSGERQLAEIGGQGRLQYSLYQDTGRSQIWTTSDVRAIEGFGAVPIRVRVFGRIPQGQDVPVGDYEDSVLIVVKF
jgi:spore coat protein U-like protein